LRHAQNSFLNCLLPKEIASTIDSHIDEIEMEVLHASWTSEFSHSLGWSFASILECPQQVRLEGNLGSAVASRAQPRQAVLQQDQAVSAYRHSRYDKLANNYFAFVKLAAIRIWIRAYESMP
jgi:hypothetical protein